MGTKFRIVENRMCGGQKLNCSAFNVRYDVDEDAGILRKIGCFSVVRTKEGMPVM
jgi:hypothetical protein